MTNNSLTLKWGTLKAWDFSGSEKGGQLLKEYGDIGSCGSAMMQKDTQRQKEILCELVDLCDDPKGIYLDWDDKYVTKADAKRYIIDYGKEAK
jgi:hypothetical protein